MNNDFVYITASDVIEYNFCPRFIYYMKTLVLKRHEHKRYLVNKGRDIHELKLVKNKDYLRKKIGVEAKELDVYLGSEKLHLVGRMDEVLYLNDGTMAPLDYKYAEYQERLFKTLRHQQIIYSLLIEEQYKKPVNRAFIVYIRSKNYIKEFEITKKDKQKTLKQITEIFDIIENGYFPKGTGNSRKCADCTYRNLCFS